MRLSEFIGKRIVNIFDGGMLGLVGDSDLLVDPDSGGIDAIILPVRGGGLRQERRAVSIPWEAVKKIGYEVIVVDIEESLR
ncbi:MAG: YlmC/YmxH family sporulation protein [Clostridiales bacterium]|nr:YlmC/YmxH family sporulation protein [Clostridiales bacterium]